MGGNDIYIINDKNASLFLPLLLFARICRGSGRAPGVRRVQGVVGPGHRLPSRGNAPGPPGIRRNTVPGTLIGGGIRHGDVRGWYQHASSYRGLDAAGQTDGPTRSDARFASGRVLANGGEVWKVWKARDGRARLRRVPSDHFHGFHRFRHVLVQGPSRPVAGEHASHRVQAPYYTGISASVPCCFDSRTLIRFVSSGQDVAQVRSGATPSAIGNGTYRRHDRFDTGGGCLTLRTPDRSAPEHRWGDSASDAETEKG